VHLQGESRFCTHFISDQRSKLDCVHSNIRAIFFFFVTTNAMKILFVHQNFPGQYLHMVRHLAGIPGHQLVFITQRKDASLPGLNKVVYQPRRQVTRDVHHYLRDVEGGILNGQEVARVALELKKGGFVPDIMVGHNGWGEIWYLKDVFPNSPLLGYFEFFYRNVGADVGFDKSEVIGFDNAPRVRTKNIGNLLGLDVIDFGQTPTQWQRSVYPLRYQPIISVVHEGVDTDAVTPDAEASLLLPDRNVSLRASDEVVTYVARNLEPYRGFHIFMRSLPEILAQRPNAQVVIVGGDETSYGPPPTDGRTHRQTLLSELDGSLDLSRIHFLGKVPYSTYLQVLRVSKAHVYLTYPFVLSWSMLESMSAGCLVIGSRTPPVVEVVEHGVNGLLVDFFSSREVAAAVIEALEDRRAHDHIRRAARLTIVTRYDLKRICLPGQLGLVERIAGCKNK
jgi:glycosyltransferase involved in cell wall biosynthesis